VNTYKTYDFGRQYSAIVYQLNIPRNDYFINDIVVANLDGMNNDRVEALHIRFQDVRFLPRGVFNWFKNINHFHVVSSGLVSLGTTPLDRRIRYVHFDDNKIYEIPQNFFTESVDLELLSMERNYFTTLRPETFVTLPKLRFVSLAMNQIRVLPANLFAKNTQLECVSFEGNLLTRIDVDLVAGLTNLKGISFDNNLCINSAYWNEQNVRGLLKDEFAANCNGRCDGMADRCEKMFEIKKKLKKYDEISYISKHVENNSVENSSEEYQYKQRMSSGSQQTPCPYAHYKPMQ
jgi:hypothetical protein